MLYVCSGKYKGKGIASPRGNAIRPTTGLVRESVFNRIQYNIEGARFLDLFAGTGIMALEALSRNAAFALLVDKKASHTQAIQKNYAALKIPEASFAVVNACAIKFSARKNQKVPFDFIFLDPPYGFSEMPGVIGNIFDNNWLCKGGQLFVEQAREDAPLPGFSVKYYGDTALYIHG
ncbi:MAG: 16S rRNA (guanine(966)-N(2))-methyltransferase RsmD [Cyanobacteria bacterium P01_H01_bin.74]